MPPPGNHVRPTIQVANTPANRNLMFSLSMPRPHIPLCGLVLLPGFLIWAAVGRALAPMERARRDIGQRDALRYTSSSGRVDLALNLEKARSC